MQWFSALRGVNCRLGVPSFVIAHPGIDGSSHSGFFVFFYPIIGDSVSAAMENNAQCVHNFFYFTQYMYFWTCFRRSLQWDAGSRRSLLHLAQNWLSKLCRKNMKEGKIPSSCANSSSSYCDASWMQNWSEISLVELHQLLNVRTRLDKALQPLSDKVVVSKVGKGLYVSRESPSEETVIDWANNYILQRHSSMTHRTWFMVSCRIIRDSFNSEIFWDIQAQRFSYSLSNKEDNCQVMLS